MWLLPNLNLMNLAYRVLGLIQTYTHICLSKVVLKFNSFVRLFPYLHTKAIYWCYSSFFSDDYSKYGNFGVNFACKFSHEKTSAHVAISLPIRGFL